jgi:hypothetical protein
VGCEWRDGEAEENETENQKAQAAGNGSAD